MIAQDDASILTRSSKDAVVRITSKGQVTIPEAVRLQAGLMPGTDVDFLVDGQEVRLVRAEPGSGRKTTRGQQAVKRFAGSATTHLTHAELMALLRDDD